MTTTFDAAIREHLYRYLTDEIELHVFEDWFIGVAWERTGTADAPLTELIGSIELALAEYSSGHATILELREDLQGALYTFSVGEPRSIGGASTTVIQEELKVVALAGGAAGVMLASVMVSA